MNNIANMPHREGDQAETRVRDDFQQIIARARAVGIDLIVATDIMIGVHDDWGNTIRSWAGRMRGHEGYEQYINKHVTALNTWLTATAKRGAAAAARSRVGAQQRPRPAQKRISAADGHITAAGYQALTAYARPILEQHFLLPPAASRP